MLKDTFSNEKRFSMRSIVASFILVTNAFVWYFYAFYVLTEIMRTVELTSIEASTIWILNFIGAAVFALSGAAITSKIGRRVMFLLVWMLLGVVFSFFPMLLDVSMTLDLFVVSFLFGASFGLGMPTAMAYFADSTLTENRARLGGIIFLGIGLGTFLLGIINVAEIATKIMVLAILRVVGFLIFFLIRPAESQPRENKSLSYTLILSQRSFLLYLIPWVMFCLVNQTSAPILMSFFGEDFVNIFAIIEGILAGTFAVISGFFCDRIGRKRLSILGFAMLGIGYATLGIFPPSLPSWYFYTLADGIAWGIFYTVFFATIWSDLAYGAPSDKYYALGGLPYLLSNFLRFVLGQYIAETISMYTIFSLASFFLFLAVIPLIYAPETLPEKKIKERELKEYIGKAKKAKKKHT